MDPVAEINLTDFKFYFAFGVAYANNSLSATEEYNDFLEYTLSFVRWESKQHSVIKEKVNIEVNHCKYEDFPYKELLDKITFEEKKLVKLYCPDFKKMKQHLRSSQKKLSRRLFLPILKILHNLKNGFDSGQFLLVFEEVLAWMNFNRELNDDD